MRGRREPEHGKWPWPASGAAVGVVIAVAWWASTFGDRPVGITFAANTGHLLTYPMVGYPNRVTWSMLMALGVPLGAFVAAWTTGQFAWKFPAASSLLKIFLGGLLMGAAALVAEGCNINQGLTNSATLALGQPADVRVDVRRRLRDALVPVSPQVLASARVGRAAPRGAGGGLGSHRSPLTEARCARLPDWELLTQDDEQAGRGERPTPGPPRRCPPGSWVSRYRPGRRTITFTASPGWIVVSPGTTARPSAVTIERRTPELCVPVRRAP